MLDTALHLATTLGWCVHPLHGIRDGVCTCYMAAQCRSAGKHPVFSGWVDLATNNPDIIRQWDWTDRNVGVVPHNFTILDFDGHAGRRTLEQLTSHLPELPDQTPVVLTGSGGYHVYISGEAPTKTGLLPGLDVRGVGGQAVLPPSLHYSGCRYKWLNGPDQPQTAPQWLRVAKGHVPDDLKPVTPLTKDEIRRISKKHRALTAVLAGLPFAEVGQRNTVLTSVAGALARAYPYCDPRQVATHFEASFAAMADEAGAPTTQDLISMLERFCAKQRAELTRRPRILVTCEIEKMSNEAIDALAASPLQIYSRAGSLVRVKPPEALPDGAVRGVTPEIFESLTLPNLKAYLSDIVGWYKETADGPKDAKPPIDVVARIADRGEWPGIPHAERIVTGAILRPDGSIYPGGGYDEVTGVICVGLPDNEPLPSVEESVDLLMDMVCDFPFESEVSKAAWLASLLTSISQQVFRGPSPLFLIDANTRAAGKSLLAETTIVVATGRAPARATLGQDDVEDRKVITSHARDGAQCILIDNVVGSFGTGKLCEALSLHSSAWTDRVLQKNRTWSGVLKPTWFATANNISLAADMGRRICYVRLDSPLERPEHRSGFRHPSLLSWVTESRPALYRAALAILHHYMSAGRPQQPLRDWGGYEHWSALVRQAIVWIGLPDPESTSHDLAPADEEQVLIELLFDGLSSIDRDVFSPSYLHGLLYGSGVSGHTKLREALESGCVQKQAFPTPQSIGRLLARFRGRVVNGMKLVKAPKGSFWRLKKSNI